MTRKSLTALLMGTALVAVLALPALAQDATEAATPPATEVPTAVQPTPVSTSEATAVTTAESTATTTAEVTQPASTTPAPTGTAMATAESTSGAVAVPANAIVSGLSNPRGINYDANGNLFIAEAGSAGPISVGKDPDSGEETFVGVTSKITEFSAAATESAPVPFLISVGNPASEISGAVDVIPRDNSIWIAVGGVPQDPFSDAAIEIDKASGGTINFVSPAAYETQNNPDGTDVNSNVNAIALGPDSTLYIIDAGGNTIYSWTQAAGLKVFHTWKDDPVPTGMAFAPDGSFYVSFLGTGIAPNAGRVEHWSADGQTLTETFSNLTAVTDVAVGKDGSVYAVELVTGFGAQGPALNTGAVVKLANGTATVIEGNLPQPYSLAQAPDGSWAVSVNSTFSPPGSGAVVKIS